MTTLNSGIFNKLNLDNKHTIWITKNPVRFSANSITFEDIWNLHPEEFHTLVMHGKEVKTPRWQQAYGKDYRYTGAKNNALPIIETLYPFLKWSQENIDEGLNGMLLNWYDGASGHYIGAHRDDTRDLVVGSKIVTISLGEERTFRLRPLGLKGYKDYTMRSGEVIVVPWDTNLHWTHEVPSFRKHQGKRISVTLREFK